MVHFKWQEEREHYQFVFFWFKNGSCRTHSTDKIGGQSNAILFFGEFDGWFAGGYRL